MVSKVHALNKEQDILAEPAKNLGKQLSEETVQKVKSFYENELSQESNMYQSKLSENQFINRRDSCLLTSIYSTPPIFKKWTLKILFFMTTMACNSGMYSHTERVICPGSKLWLYITQKRMKIVLFLTIMHH
jgi:hypothetical protein